MGHRRPRNAVIVVLLALLMAAPLALRPATASAQAETGDVTFGELTATPSFPDVIDFSFSAQTGEAIQRVELLFNAVGEETLHLITPDVAEDERTAFDFGLNMFQNYYPPGLDLEYRWRVTSASGAVTESEQQIVGWYDTRFDWTSIASDQVTVYTYDTNDNFAEEILASAQGTIDDLETEYGIERSEPLRVWVYNSQADLGGATEPNSEPWIAGVSYPGRFLILAAVPDGNSMELRRVIPHEVSHQVLFQATENPFNFTATWLDEGIATYNQDVGTDDYVALVEQAVAADALMPIETLNMSFPYDDTFQLAYAESYSIVSYIIQTYGEEALGDVLNAYKDGVTHEEAVQAGLGVSVEELDQQWQESLGAEHDQSDDGTGGGTVDLTGGDWINGMLAMILLLAVPLTLVRWWRTRRTPYDDEVEQGLMVTLVRPVRER
jgi:hypothetical protein